MQIPITLHGELLVPLPVRYDLPSTELEAQLRQAGLLPWTVQQCRWRLDAERSGYVVSYEVVMNIETAPGGQEPS
jgi:hypothetical protein